MLGPVGARSVLREQHLRDVHAARVDRRRKHVLPVLLVQGRRHVEQTPDGVDAGLARCLLSDLDAAHRGCRSAGPVQKRVQHRIAAGARMMVRQRDTQQGAVADLRGELHALRSSSFFFCCLRRAQCAQEGRVPSGQQRGQRDVRHQPGVSGERVSDHDVQLVHVGEADVGDVRRAPRPAVEDREDVAQVPAPAGADESVGAAQLEVCRRHRGGEPRGGVDDPRRHALPHLARLGDQAALPFVRGRHAQDGLRQRDSKGVAEGPADARDVSAVMGLGVTERDAQHRRVSDQGVQGLLCLRSHNCIYQALLSHQQGILTPLGFS